MKAGQSKQCLLAAAILFLTFLAYQPIWHAGFVWDDDVYVTDNQTLRSPDGLREIWSSPGATVQYYPLVFTSFWVEHHLWQLKPLGYHLVNVLLHALNAILLWRLLRRLELPGAWLAAVIFAIHPVTVESVAWITERKNVLSCLFYLLAMSAFLRFRQLADAKVGRAFDWRYYPVVLAAFLCALLSKTVTCTLPAVLLLVVWWKKGHVEKRDALAMMPLFVLGALLGLATLHLEKQAGASGAEWKLSFVQRCLVAGRALWFYAGQLAWPRDLAFIYPRWTIDAGAAWQYLFPLAALAVIVGLWKLRSRIGRGPLVAVLCFAGTLVPALGFFDVYPFRYSYVADHFQYMACIGLIALTAGAGAAMFQRIGGYARDIVVAASVALLMALGSTTWEQAHAYRDLETLWRDTLAKNPGCWMAHVNLGTVLTEKGELQESIWHCEQALRLNPDFAEAHNNLGNAFLREGRVSEAIGCYEQSLRIQPNYADVQCNLGVALQQAGRVSEAVQHWQEALRLKPDYAAAHNNLGGALSQAGKPEEAIRHYEQALRIRPDYAEAHYNLGAALYQTGKREEAREHYQQALRIKPDFVAARDALARLQGATALGSGKSP
jgi:tetratricopeptide (TPR) repeat protein